MRMSPEVRRCTREIQWLPSLGLASIRAEARSRPSMRKAMAKARNRKSRVRFQNFRKKTPARMEVVAITPPKKPLIIESRAFPDQPIEQKQHSNGRCEESPDVEIDVGEDHETEKWKYAREGEREEAETAPE